MIMKRLGCDITLLLLSVAVLWNWLHVQYGYCSQKNDLQYEFQTKQDSAHQQEESRHDERRDEVLPPDPANTNEHQSETDAIPADELRTHETGLREEKQKDLQVDITLAESISDQDLESSILPEQNVISEDANLFSDTAATVTATQPADFSTASVSSGSATCSAGEDSCSSAALSADSPPAACDASENQSYETNLNSLPVILENSSSTGTGRGTKSGLGRESQGTNASSRMKKKGGAAETDPSPPDTDAEDIPTFDEWKKIMMEEENEKSQSTHTSFTGATGTVKKVLKTTNYASVECGAKILSSNPEAKSTSAILMENVDVYMLNPCSNKIWFIIELCQPIQVKQLDIANFELFSSTPKDFLVSISDRYPTNKWSKLGTFHARDERTIQSFPLDEHLYAKYVKVELLSHFGSEHFCPLSLIRIFGTSMMEEYELNSEPSERLIQDDDDDYPAGYVPSDDNTSKDIIVSAKDAIINMVNNIAANVLGGNPEDGVHSGGNSSSPDLNSSESSGSPVQTTQPPLESSNIMMESLNVDEQIAQTTDTQSRSTSQTISLATASFSEDLSATSSSTILTLSPTPTAEEQIVTLLPEEDELEELEQAEHSLHSISQEENKSAMAEHDQLFSRIRENINCCEHTSGSCSSSLEEYLLQICVPLLKEIRVKKSIESLETPTLVLEEISSLKEQVIYSRIMEPSSPTSVMASVTQSEHSSEDASLELLPSLTSTLTFYPTDAFCSKASQAVDFLAPSSVQELDTTFSEMSREDAAGTPLLMPHVHLTFYQEINTKTDQLKSGFTERSPTEEKTLSPGATTTTTMHEVSLIPLTPFTEPLIVQPSESETIAPAVTEPFVVIASEDLQDAVLGGFGSSLQSGASGNEQLAQPSSSEFYAEMQSSTETPISGSNQKESVFMRLNNRIKALEVNMSLSGRYLEQLSQRYRKQMEEMQKAFNKTIIKLQNTSKMAEEQDQRQTESIQLLQRQLENMTQLVLNLSVQVSQLQSEVSDRHSYLLLCVILCLLASFIVRTKICRSSSEDPSAEQDASSPNSYSYCSPDGRPAGFQSTSGYEELSPVRRASYPFSQSSLQIAPIKDLTKTCNAKSAQNSSGNKKKKRCKMKSSGKPEMMAAPTAVSLSSVPNGGLACNTHPSHNPDFNFSFREPEPHHSAFNFREVSSEESSEESSQSDEPSFCGIATCRRLCEPLPSHKIRLKKRGRLKNKGTVLEQLLQPAKHKGPQVTTDFTKHGFLMGSTEVKTQKTGVLQLNVKNNYFD